MKEVKQNQWINMRIEFNDGCGWELLHIRACYFACITGCDYIDKSM
jgi:hypothetical protein